jgi:hypothetical protein
MEFAVADPGRVTQGTSPRIACLLKSQTEIVSQWCIMMVRANASSTPYAQQPTCVDLQEVIRRTSRDHWFASTWAGVKLQAGHSESAEEQCARKAERRDLQSILEVLVDFHDRCLVAATVAVIRR